MPAVTANSSTKVLVTGANGFVAIWLVQTLLQKGYSVLGTVRSPSKATYLKEKFKEFGDRLEIAIVEDIGKKGAFDDVVRHVDAIEHTASPFHFNATDLEELLVPAVQGTVGILESALQYGTKVKRIVITSSCAAIAHPAPPKPTVYTEKDWNLQSVDEAKSSGNGGAIYRASKVLSEQAAWEWYETNKSEITWDLTVMNPPWIFGPILHEISSPSDLNTSSAHWYNSVIKGSRATRAALTEGASRIDVRDLAQAFVLAIEKEVAGGERIIVGAGPFIWQDWLNVVNELETPPTKHTIPEGYPDISKGYVYPVSFDTSKADQVLGVKYRSFGETAIDCLKDFEARGW